MYYGFEEDKSKHNSGIIYEYAPTFNTKTFGQILDEIYAAVDFKADRFYKIALAASSSYTASPTHYYDCYYNSGGAALEFAETWVVRSINHRDIRRRVIVINKTNRKFIEDDYYFSISDKTIENFSSTDLTDNVEQYVSLRLYEL